MNTPGKFSQHLLPFSWLLFVVACTLPAQVTGEWRQLYTSERDGLSFNRLANAVSGYDGPTVREASPALEA